jgi:hypothetical protein
MRATYCTIIGPTSRVTRFRRDDQMAFQTLMGKRARFIFMVSRLGLPLFLHASMKNPTTLPNPDPVERPV